MNRLNLATLLQRFNMTCPRCIQDVGLFGRALIKPSRFARDCECPHCGAAVRLGYDFETLALTACIYLAAMILALGFYFVSGVGVFIYLFFFGFVLVHFFSLDPRLE